MTDQIERRDPQLRLAPADRLALSRAMTRDHEAFLAPGERFAIDAEVGQPGPNGAPEYVWAQLLLGTPDDTFRLEVEGAMVPADQPPEQSFPEGRDAISELLAFLRLQVYEFFRLDRQLRFHDDWRLQPFQGKTLRFRGAVRYPGLDERADELLGQ
ncbi:MAG: hypothetical protein VX475_13845 [Myxococcota bacterium]|nr:hypothetical protein [Myxococcota bacterium]